MIRINLLAEGKRPVAARPRRAPTGPGLEAASWLLIGVSALGLLVALGNNFLLGRALEAKRTEVAEAQREVDELAPIIREVEEFKQKQGELERKVNLVNQLKTNQLGPVRIMDHVSRALPQLLWLTRMEVRPSTIFIAGQAFNTNAVASFIENLDSVPVFDEPVLRETTQRGAVYTFSIEFGYSFEPSQEGGAEPVEVAGG